MARGGKFRGKRRGGKFRGRRRGGRFRGRRRGGKRRGGAQRGGKLQKFKSAVQKLKRLKPSQQVQAMKMANSRFIKHMCSEVRKLKYKPLPAPLQSRVRKNAKRIRKFVNTKTSMRAKRRMLTQQGGGFLPLILAGLAAPLIGKIARGVLG